MQPNENLRNIDRIMEDLKKSCANLDHFQRLEKVIKNNLDDAETILNCIDKYKPVKTSFFSGKQNAYQTYLNELRRHFQSTNLQDLDARSAKLMRALKGNYSEDGTAEIKYVEMALKTGSAIVVNYISSFMRNTNEHPLFLALATMNKEIIELLLSYGATLPDDFDIDKTIKDGKTLFHIACELDLKSLAIEAIAKGADINKPRKDGATPLHIVCKEINQKADSYGPADFIFKILLNRNAKLKIGWKDPDATPFFYLIEKRKFNLAEIMLQQGYKVTEFDLLQVRKAGPKADQLYKMMKQPFKEEKKRIVEGSVREEVMPSDSETHEKVNRICSQVFSTQKNYILAIRKALTKMYEEDRDNIISPLLNFLSHAAKGERQNTNNKKPMKWIITEDSTIETLTGGRAIGEFTKKKYDFCRWRHARVNDGKFFA